MKNILLVGDLYGIPELLDRIPLSRIAALVVAEIRAHEHDRLRKLADQSGLPLIVQPRKTSADYANFQSRISSFQPDGLICHSYSMLIQKEILDLVGGQAFNVHMALLPRNRGPNPVQWALIHGDAATGVSLHLMSEAFDTGAVVDVAPVAVLPDDSWVSLLSRLKKAAQTLLDRAVPLLLSGNWSARAQDESAAVLNPRIPAESFEIRFSTMTDLQIYNLIRAQVAPLKGAYLQIGGRTMRFPGIVSLNEVAELRKLYA